MEKREKIVIAIAGGLILFSLLAPPKSSPQKNPASNQQYIDTLHPKYKKRFVDFINHLNKLGWRVQINSAYRTFKRSAELKKEDKRNASPGFSPHNYGMAIDMQVWDRFGKAYHKNSSIESWQKTGIPNLAKSYGLGWGGTFKGYPDTVHFYVPEVDTEKLYKMAVNQFKTTNPDKIIGNKLTLAQRANKRPCGCLGSNHYCVLN